FSSRRRHTRSKRDWSSDVCSSDLSKVVPKGMQSLSVYLHEFFIFSIHLHTSSHHLLHSYEHTLDICSFIVSWHIAQDTNEKRKRSEERRVGKECRRQWIQK